MLRFSYLLILSTFCWPPLLAQEDVSPSGQSAADERQRLIDSFERVLGAGSVSLTTRLRRTLGGGGAEGAQVVQVIWAARQLVASCGGQKILLCGNGLFTQDGVRPWQGRYLDPASLDPPVFVFRPDRFGLLLRSVPFHVARSEPGHMSEKQGVLKSVTLRGDWARELLYSGALPDPFPLALISGNGAGLDGEPIRSRIVLDLAFLMVGDALHSLSARVYDYGMDAGDVARMMGLPEPSLQEVDDSELVYDGGLPVREGEACQQVYQLAVEFRYPRLQSVAGGSPEDRRALIRALEWALAQGALAYRTEHSFGGGAGVVESSRRTVSVNGSGSRSCVVAGAEGLEFVFLNGRMAVRDHGESWRLRAGRLPNGAVMPFVLVPHGLLEGLLAVSMPVVQAEDVSRKGRPSRVIAVELSAESSWVLLRDGVLPWPPGCSRSWIPDSAGLLRAVKIPVQIDLAFCVDVKTGALVGLTVMVYCVAGAVGARDDIDEGEWCPIVGSDEGLLMREVPEGVTASVLRVWVDGACENPQSAVDEGAARVLRAH